MGESLPGGAGSYAEAHVALLGEGVVPQLFEVLGSQVFVRVPGHGILTWWMGLKGEILVFTKKKKHIPKQERGRVGGRMLQHLRAEKLLRRTSFDLSPDEAQ